MLKLKLVQIIEVEPTLAKLIKLAEDGELEFKLSYKIERIIRKLKPEFQDFYEEREKLLKKFGTESEDEKGSYKVNDVENYQNNFSKLLDFDIELTNIYPFKLEELESIKSLTIKDVAVLNPFIEQPLEEEEKERKKITLEID